MITLSAGLFPGQRSEPGRTRSSIPSIAFQKRVMTSSNRYLQARLKLQVKAAKSAVDRPWNRKFLGYSMTFHKQPRLKVAPAVVARLKESVREECRKGRS